jgi:predicted lipoprotein with Yx(FWY)xxD motif
MENQRARSAAILWPRGNQQDELAIALWRPIHIVPPDLLTLMMRQAAERKLLMKHLISIMHRPGWLALGIAFSLVLAACSPSTAAVSTPGPTPLLTATGTPAAPPAAPTASPQVSIPDTGSAVVQAVANLQFGQILVTADGRTLYSNTADSAGQIVCANSDCTNFWPPYIVAAQPAAMEGNPGALGTVTRPDGTLQLTYNQKPLYTFYLDQAAGDAKGNGFVDLGGTWGVVSLVSAPPVSSPVPAAPTSSSSGGYQY